MRSMSVVSLVASNSMYGHSSDRTCSNRIDCRKRRSLGKMGKCSVAEMRAEFVPINSHRHLTQLAFGWLSQPGVHVIGAVSDWNVVSRKLDSNRLNVAGGMLVMS